MDWTEMMIASTLTVYFGTFAIALVLVRRETGENPFGQAWGHAREKLLSGLAMVLLLTTGISYVIDPRSAQWSIRVPWLDGPSVRVLSTAFCSLASGLLAWGVASLGRCFRVALPERQEHLVTQGIYRWVRNPLALSIDPLSLGLLGVAPSCLAVASCVLTVVAYELKIRAEERYLRQAHGPAYAAYCARSGRYIPRVLSKWRREGALQ